jgi:hypothetical protein
MSNELNGGVKSTTVKYTGSGKPFGADVFITVETTHEFANLATDEEVLTRQEEIAVQLTAQVTDMIKQAVASTKSSVPQYQPPAASALPQYSPAPAGTGAPAVVAVANGATQQQGDWRSVASRFGDGQIRFIASSVYSSDKLKADVCTWISNQGIDASLFDIWDERTGPKGAEAGVPIGSVFNIKVKKDQQHLVPEDFHRNAAGRGKFNNDGSLYPYWSKDFEAFLKFGGKAQLENTGF